MPLDLELEPGEEIILDATLPGADKDDVSFSVAVSDRAIFVQRKKRVAIADPWYLDKIPLGRIRRVQVAHHSPAWLWISSALLVAAGLGGLVLVGSGDEPARHWQLIAFSLAFIAVGLAIPWALRSRLRLRVEMIRGNFTWVSRLVLGGSYLQDSRRFLLRFADACRRAGLLVETPGSGLGAGEPEPPAAVVRDTRVERAERPRATRRQRLAVSLVLYGAFVVLCFAMEITARERFRVPSEADVEAIDDRVQRIRTEAARNRALAAMRDWPPYAAYATGVEVLLLLGFVIGPIVGVVAAWRRLRPTSIFEAKLLVVVLLLVFFGVLVLVGGPRQLAERYVEDRRTSYAAECSSR